MKKLNVTVPNKVYVSLASLLLAFVVSGIILALIGYNPLSAYGAMLSGAFGGMNEITDMLGTATPLILTGLAVAVAMKGGVVNIGCEGQLYMGAMAAALTGVYVELPVVLHAIVCLLAACLAGGLWAALAGWLKVKLAVNEVIITIMLNYIAIYFTDYLATYWFKDAGMVVRTERILTSAKLDTLYPHSRLTWGFFVAIAMVALFHFVLKKTVFGYELQATGSNLLAAQTAGVKTSHTFMYTMFLSGLLAGLAGAVEVLGVHGYFISGFSPGYGFDGLSIAVLGQYTPIGVAISAVLYGALRSGATMMDRVTDIPSDIVVIMQALVIIFVATPELVRVLKLRKKEGK